MPQPDLQRLIPPSVRAPLQRGCVLTIGNFDGVHLGHQRILACVAEDAASRRLPTAALTFEPHPVEVFAGIPAEELRLTTAHERTRLLRVHGIHHVITIPFDRAFASLAPDAFLETLVGSLLCARSVHVGYDFNFGRDRAGDTHTLRAHAQRGELAATVHDAVLHGGLPISSTRIRKALRSAALDEAQVLLGRPWTLNGHTQRGAGRGKSLGIPTINLYPTRLLLPPRGVYATRIVLDGRAESLPAITNIGVRPTFADDVRVSVETLCLDHDPGTVPEGTAVEVRFLAFLRPERAFDDPAALVAQIAQDREAAERVHAGTTSQGR